MIIVFGAAGFIGTYLIDQLVRDGYKVVAVDKSDFGVSYYKEQKVSYYQIDITDRCNFDQLPCENVEAVINLACVQPANVSEKKYDPADYIKVNVLGTLNTLDFCRKTRVSKMIYTCSHRNTQGLLEQKEGTPIS